MKIWSQGSVPKKYVNLTVFKIQIKIKKIINNLPLYGTFLLKVRTILFVLEILSSY
jgi:hypothetical protein